MNENNPVEILLVEDNPRDAELTIRALKKNNLANHLVHVEDGAEALDFLFAHGKYEGRSVDDTPRVILLDLKLPKVSGLEVLRLLKEDQRTRMIPVVVVTSSTEDPDMETAYALGANSYVVKPVQFDNFIEAMRHLGIYWLIVNRPLK
jgi:two-component system response regulator